MSKFFDKLEDRIREYLSRHPIVYSLIGGAGVVLFWRAIWDTADILSSLHPMLEFVFYPPVQLLITSFVLLLTGLMVSIFIGDRILLSGLRHEKKLEEKTEELVQEEVITLAHIQEGLRKLEKEIKKISDSR